MTNNKTTNNFHFTGGIQGGAVSLGGNAENKGNVSLQIQSQSMEAIQSELAKVERELHSSSIDDNLKKEALDHVADAKIDPSPDKISRAVSTLSKVEELAKKVPGTGTAITTAIAYLSSLL